MATAGDDAPREEREEREKRWRLIPEKTSSGETAETIICPFCQSYEVEPLSMFGAQLLTDQYYCRACHTPFEHVRAVDDIGARDPLG